MAKKAVDKAWRSVLDGCSSHNPFFLAAGAEAFRRDIPKAEVHFYERGHFALETHAAEIAETIRKFLKQNLRAL